MKITMKMDVGVDYEKGPFFEMRVLKRFMLFGQMECWGRIDENGGEGKVRLGVFDVEMNGFNWRVIFQSSVGEYLR